MILFSTPNWLKDKVTQNQLNYIGKMIKDNPNLPAFKGTTKGEAAEYIEKYRKEKQHGKI